MGMWSYIYYILGWELPEENKIQEVSDDVKTENLAVKDNNQNKGKLSEITNNCLLTAKSNLKKIKKTIPIANYPTQEELINNSISKNIKSEQSNKIIINESELIETKNK